MKIRLSLGSAVHLGLRKAKMDVSPTTLYMLVGDACWGACRFCAQARDSDANPKYLSRIVWPEFSLDEVLAHLPNPTGIGRICLQTLNSPRLFPQLETITARIHAACSLPLSVCMNPTSKAQLHALKDAGVERVGVGLDCATETLFNEVKPGFNWKAYLRLVEDTLAVFGIGSVHLIVGLGETDADLIRQFQRFSDRGCSIALFAFTPVRGAKLSLPQPPVPRYRRLQLARYLITKGQATYDDMEFRDGHLCAIHVAPAVLERAITSGRPFRTSGCPSCNRPLYNERPGGVMYNYAQPLDEQARQQVRQQVACAGPTEIGPVCNERNGRLFSD